VIDINRNLRRLYKNSLLINLTQQKPYVHGKPFPAEHGITQGDIISPIIFNIVMDVVLHHWYKHMASVQMHTTTLHFYADDGHMGDTNATYLQHGLDTVAHLLLKVGLKLNGTKTKAMISFPPTPTTMISPTAYQCRILGKGLTHQQCLCQLIICTLCNKILTQGSL